ncbi:glycosyltransferase [Coprothermobacter platensis]|uniref:glycosyltransferase n=1 Tax=Coprothermobacter platensis TaxID=108819 RepID=UPI00035DB9A4|nr:glycosyltransferase [Coprothermobacter platensis]
MMKGIFLFVLYQLLNSLINFFLIRKPRQCGDLNDPPRVSILVPARNEEENIAKCVQSLLLQDYTNYEVLVLNDGSEDGTGKVLSMMANTDERLQVIESADPLPEGWTGKNWACHRLFLQSTGDILIFTDADTFHSPKTITTMVQEMQRQDLSFISGIPREVVVSFGEKITVPFISYSIVSIFPLFLSYFSPIFSSLSVANGQFMMFNRHSYERIGGHAAVKGEIVEDIELAKLVRSHGLRMYTSYNLSGLVSCRMYGGFKEAFNGLSKSYFALFSLRIIPSIFVWTWMFLVAVYPFIALIRPPDTLLAICTIIMTTLIWLGTSIDYKLPRYVVLFHPLITVVNSVIGFHSIAQGCTGNTSWKGRTINVKKPSWF